jgi:colicin import membrane protein
LNAHTFSSCRRRQELLQRKQSMTSRAAPLRKPSDAAGDAASACSSALVKEDLQCRAAMPHASAAAAVAAAVAKVKADAAEAAKQRARAAEAAEEAEEKQRARTAEAATEAASRGAASPLHGCNNGSPSVQALRAAMAAWRRENIAQAEELRAARERLAAAMSELQRKAAAAK